MYEKPRCELHGFDSFCAIGTGHLQYYILKYLLIAKRLEMTPSKIPTKS